MTDPLRAALREGRLTDAEVESFYSAFDAVTGTEARSIDGKRAIVEPLYSAFIAIRDARLLAALAADTARPDPRTIERLTRALGVANHSPHDRDGEPNPESGFPTCSGCGAILTAADTARPVGQNVQDVQDALDEAWREAEAALPEGWVITDLVLVALDGVTRWKAVAGRATGEGPTPAAALRALAARLTESRS